MSHIPLLIFAKAPQAGKVKTRLMTDCSAEQAAAIALILLKASLDLATKAWPGKVALATWPDINNQLMQDLARQYDVELVLQGPGDLGQKMAHGLDQHGYPAAVMGSDAALVETTSLHLAHQLLAEGKNVIGPSSDGGYYLIGLSSPQPQLFADLPWGTEKVLELTLARQSELAQLSPLAESYDVDTWQDVQRAREVLPELKAYLRQASLN